MKLKLFTFLFFIFTFFTFNFAQTLDKFNRIRTYDVQNYIIRVGFEHSKRLVKGDTTVQLKPLADNFMVLELDAVNMQFESVKLEPEGKDLSYEQVGEKVIIKFEKPYSKNDLISVRFKYSTVTCKDLKRTTSCKGVYFTKQTGTNNEQIWTQGEPEEAHHWFPSYDFPDDKATVEQFITVKKDETAIGNGELLGITENTDNTKTFNYKTSFAFSTYLVSMVVGKYVKLEDKYRDIPLGFYVYKGKENISIQAYQNTKKVFKIFEDLTKINYPYNKYDQTIVSEFTAGGMENITATTLDDSSILFGFNYFTEDLISHEIAHSWFGNLVTNRNWAELWLNEGFATFMEAAYREKAYGRADYEAKINDDARSYQTFESLNNNRRGLYNQLARPDDSIFDAITYQKGGVVLHQLREQIGTENFWKGANLYLNRHKFGNVETPDLQKAMEEASQQDLTWFFKQWVYGAGYPKLNFSKSYSVKNKELTVTINQIQPAFNLQPDVFILPLELEIITNKNKQIEILNVNKRTNTFKIKLNQKPTSVLLDTNKKIPLKMVSSQKMKITK